MLFNNFLSTLFLIPRCWIFLIIVTTVVLLLFIVVPWTNKCQNTQTIIRDWSIFSIDNSTEYQQAHSVLSDSSFRRQFRGEEIRHLAFLKVHKAASSTVTSIIQRFGWERNLNFLLPARSPNLISQNESINVNNIISDKDATFDLLCNHVIYDKEQFTKYLPKDTVFIGIVREPFDQFVSSVYYYKYRWSVPYLARLPSINPVKYLLESPNQYEPKKRHDSYTRNRMSVDFGLPEELLHTTDKRKILPYLKELNSEFKLVLIKEYFDESIILLRRMLNWNLRDVLYVSKNSLKYVPKINVRDRHRHKQHSFLDYCLYNFFLRVFWKKVRQQGEDFHMEVAYFRQLRSAVEDFCNEEKRNPAFKRRVFEAEANEFHPDIVINKDLCELMTLNEVDFTNKLKWRQFPNLRP